MKLLALSVALWSWGSATHSASFDCSAVTHVSDRTICLYDELSRLEERYVESYLYTLSMGGDYQSQAREIARAQMSARRACLDDASCIYSVLSEATNVLTEVGYGAMAAGTSDFHGSTENRRWESIAGLPDDELIALVSRFEDECRGQSTALHIESCSTRNEVYSYLKEMRDICYGRKSDEGTAFYEWHNCGYDSY